MDIPLSESDPVMVISTIECKSFRNCLKSLFDNTIGELDHIVIDLASMIRQQCFKTLGIRPDSHLFQYIDTGLIGPGQILFGKEVKVHPASKSCALFFIWVVINIFRIRSSA